MRRRLVVLLIVMGLLGSASVLASKLSWRDLAYDHKIANFHNGSARVDVFVKQWSWAPGKEQMIPEVECLWCQGGAPQPNNALGIAQGGRWAS